MSEQLLASYRQIWSQKPVLRAIYRDYYRRIVTACKPGSTLEIGGGSGNLQEYLTDVISTDIVPTPWLHAAADAHALPFVDNSFANIVAVDVLHHIERPKRFLAEAQRVLMPGARLILLDPAITPVSWLFYWLFHPEPVRLGVDPLADRPPDPDRNPFDANQAIPTLLFGRYRKSVEVAFPSLRIVTIERLSFLAYPLSGGFRQWSFIPARAVPIILKTEEILAPVIGRLMAFRIFVVMEKAADESKSDTRTRSPLATHAMLDRV